MKIAVLHLHLELPGCASLKEKRSLIKPVLARLHREFNLAGSETGLQDHWQSAILSFVTIGTDAGVVRASLQSVLEFAEKSFPDVTVMDHSIEMMN